MTAAVVTRAEAPRTDHATQMLRVEWLARAADGVLLMNLVDPTGAELPLWEPGAHLELVLPSGMVRHYSLCGPTEDRLSYTVAVLRVGDGRGGSIEIHDVGLLGRSLEVRGPRNHFPLVAAGAYLLLAGGIGVTPLVSMARELAGRGADWHMVYGGRSAEAMAFRRELAEAGGERVTLVPQDELGLPDFAALLASVAPGTAVYCCGPDGMIRHVEDLCRPLGEQLTLHVERFAASGEVGERAEPGDTAFDVELRRRGVVLTVPADRTALDVVREVVRNHPYSCLEGECGSCEVTVLEGEIDHRDDVLSDVEKSSHEVMMLCVSRARGARLVLDL